MTGAPLLCLVKNFLGEHHAAFQDTSEEIHSGYFGMHNDYRRKPSRSKRSMIEQTLVFQTLELVMAELQSVARTFCSMDQEFLYSCVHSPYITAGVGTTLEILHLSSSKKTRTRSTFTF